MRSQVLVYPVVQSNLRVLNIQASQFVERKIATLTSHLARYIVGRRLVDWSTYLRRHSISDRGSFRWMAVELGSCCGESEHSKTLVSLGICQSGALWERLLVPTLVPIHTKLVCSAGWRDWNIVLQFVRDTCQIGWIVCYWLQVPTSWKERRRKRCTEPFRSMPPGAFGLIAVARD